MSTMTASYRAALAHLLKEEGGYVNNPADSGGETNMGITWRTYDAWRDRWKLPRQSVRLITMDEVREIYFRGYWLGVGAEKLEIIDGRTAAAVFDFGVNAGAGTSVKLLQRVLGVKETATVDTPTLAALRSRNMVDVARQLMALRLRHYYALATRRAKDRVFILNWTSRTKRVADSLGVVVQLTGSERGWAPGKPEARVLDLRPLAADATRVPVPAVVGVVAAGAPDPAPRLKPVVLGAALLAAYAAARGMGLIE